MGRSKIRIWKGENGVTATTTLFPHVNSRLNLGTPSHLTSWSKPTYGLELYRFATVSPVLPTCANTLGRSHHFEPGTFLNRHHYPRPHTATGHFAQVSWGTWVSLPHGQAKPPTQWKWLTSLKTFDSIPSLLATSWSVAMGFHWGSFAGGCWCTYLEGTSPAIRGVFSDYLTTL